MSATGRALVACMADPQHPDSRVYFVRNPETRAVKIGRTANLPSRLAQLRTAIPSLELIGHIPGGVQAESDLHLTFADRRVGGEWFLPDVAMAQTIAALISAAREVEADA